MVPAEPGTCGEDLADSWTFIIRVSTELVEEGMFEDNVGIDDADADVEWLQVRLVENRALGAGTISISGVGRHETASAGCKTLDGSGRTTFVGRIPSLGGEAFGMAVICMTGSYFDGELSL